MLGFFKIVYNIIHQVLDDIFLCQPSYILISPTIPSPFCLHYPYSENYIDQEYYSIQGDIKEQLLK